MILQSKIELIFVGMFDIGYQIKVCYTLYYDEYLRVTKNIQIIF